MPTFRPVSHAAKLATATTVTATVAALTLSLTACAAEVTPEFVAPTMAPEQSVAEACAISTETVDRITKDAEQQVTAGFDQASEEIKNLTMPSFDFLKFSVDDAFTEIESQVTNPEVLGAIVAVRESLHGFGEIALPDSLTATTGYLTALGTQLAELTGNANSLRELCAPFIN